jgi:4-hydroxy-2-oxoheptanedioate aldolase
MVYLGIYDISQVLGVPGDVKNKKVVKLIKDMVKMIESQGLVAGSVAPDREYIKLLIDSGFRFISYRADSAVLLNGFSTAYSWFQELSKDLT